MILYTAEVVSVWMINGLLKRKWLRSDCSILSRSVLFIYLFICLFMSIYYSDIFYGVPGGSDDVDVLHRVSIVTCYLARVFDYIMLLSLDKYIQIWNFLPCCQFSVQHIFYT